ncbi:unnamed protein product [Diplocarpon coronariae]
MASPRLVRRTRFAGTSGTKVARDLVEVASRVLENFSWDPNILRRVSRHYSHLSPELMACWKGETPTEAEPPAKAPLELLETLSASDSTPRPRQSLDPTIPPLHPAALQPLD